MPCQPPKALRRANTVFERFCREVHVLPADTPVFLIDGSGCIICKQRLMLADTDFSDIYSLIDENDTEYFRTQMTLTDAFLVQRRDGGGREYIVVSKDDFGFSGCVVCSGSEKGSLDLCDFVTRLCSYRDYLESFDNLAVSPMPRMPVKWLFGLKINGVLELMELTRADREPETSITFPLMMGLEKLCRFIEKVNENETRLLTDGVDGETCITVPEAFFKLVVSASALAERFSRTGKVNVDAQKIDGRNSVRISIFTHGRGEEGDIFEKALVSALESLGFYCGVRDADGVYCIWLEAPIAAPEAVTVSDAAYMSSLIDSLLENDAVSALHFTIADK